VHKVLKVHLDRKVLVHKVHKVSLVHLVHKVHKAFKV
jgi:hypothetical protein